LYRVCFVDAKVRVCSQRYKAWKLDSRDRKFWWTKEKVFAFHRPGAGEWPPLDFRVYGSLFYESFKKVLERRVDFDASFCEFWRKVQKRGFHCFQNFVRPDDFGCERQKNSETFSFARVREQRSSFYEWRFGSLGYNRKGVLCGRA
jgi:hypothetical protein